MFDADARRSLRDLGYVTSGRDLGWLLRLFASYQKLELSRLTTKEMFLQAVLSGSLRPLLPESAGLARMTMFDVLWAAKLAGFDRVPQSARVWQALGVDPDRAMPEDVFARGAVGMYEWANGELVDVAALRGEDALALRAVLEQHAALTGSVVAAARLGDWPGALDEAAKAREVFDVSGAGDTVIAALAAMLGSGAALPQAGADPAAVDEARKAKDTLGGVVEVRTLVVLSLTFDHRVVDGAPAAAFLDAVVGLLERPQRLRP